MLLLVLLVIKLRETIACSRLSVSGASAREASEEKIRGNRGVPLFFTSLALAPLTESLEQAREAIDIAKMHVENLMFLFDLN